MTPSYEEFPFGPGLSINELLDESNACKKHGRLPSDKSPACGCWTAWAEGLFEARVIRLPDTPKPKRRAA